VRPRTSRRAQRDGGDGRRHADADQPVRRRRLHRAFGGGELRLDAPGMIDEARPRLGQPHPSPAAIEQLLAEQCLQFGDPRRQRRLRHARAGRGRGKAPLIDDAQTIADQIAVDHRCHLYVAVSVVDFPWRPCLW
jgi:hypothetical protein